MSQPDPAFDALHPSGQLMFRSCRGGYLHSVVLAETALDADPCALAKGLLMAAEVSHLKAVIRIRDEITARGFTPSAQMPDPGDLDRAERDLRGHRLHADAAG